MKFSKTAVLVHIIIIIIIIPTTDAVIVISAPPRSRSFPGERCGRGRGRGRRRSGRRRTAAQRDRHAVFVFVFRACKCVKFQTNSLSSEMMFRVSHLNPKHFLCSRIDTLDATTFTRREYLPARDTERQSE